MESTANSIANNPFVSVAAKKIRNLKKKLEKIVKIEIQQLAGKVPDEEQLILLASKQSVERSITDIGTLKAQLEEVAKQIEQEEESRKLATAPVNGSKETGEVCVETDQNFSTLLSTASQYEESEGVVTSTVVVVENVAPPAIVPIETSATAVIPSEPSSKDLSILDSKVRKLLKTLHVCLRYRETTSKPLPEKVDFFGKTLLGQTSISGFEETLNNSTKSAGFYLDDEFSKAYEAIRGLKYSQLSDIIDALAEEMEATKITAALFGIHIPAATSVPPADNSGGFKDKPAPSTVSNGSRDRGSSVSLDSIISQEQQSVEFNLADQNPPPPMGLFHSGGLPPMPFMSPSQLEQLHMMHPYLHQAPPLHHFDQQLHHQLHYQQQEQEHQRQSYLYSQSRITEDSSLAQVPQFTEGEPYNPPTLLLSTANDSAVQNIAPSSGSVASQETSEQKVPKATKKAHHKGRGPPAVPGDIVPSSYIDEVTSQYAEAAEEAKSKESNNLIPVLESSRKKNKQSRPRNSNTVPITEEITPPVDTANAVPQTAPEQVSPAVPTPVEVKVKSPPRQKNSKKVPPSPLPGSEVALDAHASSQHNPQALQAPVEATQLPIVVSPPTEVVQQQQLQQDAVTATYQSLPPRQNRKRPNRKEKSSDQVRRNDADEKQEVSTATAPPSSSSVVYTAPPPLLETAQPAHVQEVQAPVGDSFQSNKKQTPSRKGKSTNANESSLHSTASKVDIALPVTVPTASPPVTSGAAVLLALQPSTETTQQTKPVALTSSGAPLLDDAAAGPPQAKSSRNKRDREKAPRPPRAIPPVQQPVPVAESSATAPVQSYSTESVPVPVPEPVHASINSKGPKPKNNRYSRADVPPTPAAEVPLQHQQPLPTQPIVQQLPTQEQPKPQQLPISQQESLPPQQQDDHQQPAKRQRPRREKKPRQQDSTAESSQQLPAQPLSQVIEPQKQIEPQQPQQLRTTQSVNPAPLKATQQPQQQYQPQPKQPQLPPAQPTRQQQPQPQPQQSQPQYQQQQQHRPQQQSSRQQPQRPQEIPPQQQTQSPEPSSQAPPQQQQPQQPPQQQTKIDQVPVQASHPPQQQQQQQQQSQQYQHQPPRRNNRQNNSHQDRSNPPSDKPKPNHSAPVASSSSSSSQQQQQQPQGLPPPPTPSVGGAVAAAPVVRAPTQPSSTSAPAPTNHPTNQQVSTGPTGPPPTNGSKQSYNNNPSSSSSRGQNYQNNAAGRGNAAPSQRNAIAQNPKK